MACGIDCTQTNISAEQAFKKLVGVAADGCPALRVEIVSPLDTVCDDFIDCENTNEEYWKSLFFQMINAEDPDCWKLKVIDAT